MTPPSADPWGPPVPPSTSSSGGTVDPWARDGPVPATDSITSDIWSGTAKHTNGTGTDMDSQPAWHWYHTFTVTLIQHTLMHPPLVCVVIQLVSESYFTYSVSLSLFLAIYILFQLHWFSVLIGMSS